MRRVCGRDRQTALSRFCGKVAAQGRLGVGARVAEPHRVAAVGAPAVGEAYATRSEPARPTAARAARNPHGRCFGVAASFCYRPFCGVARQKATLAAEPPKPPELPRKPKAPVVAMRAIGKPPPLPVTPAPLRQTRTNADLDPLSPVVCVIHHRVAPFNRARGGRPFDRALVVAPPRCGRARRRVGLQNSVCVLLVG